MRGVYEEEYRGKTETRTEHPMNTHHWLSRRTEKAHMAIRTALAQLATAEREGAKPAELRSLNQAVQDAREFADHAAAMQRAFAKRWSPGEGYIDRSDWASNMPKAAALTNIRDVATSDGEAAKEPDEPKAGPRKLVGEEDTAFAPQGETKLTRAAMLTDVKAPEAERTSGPASRAEDSAEVADDGLPLPVEAPAMVLKRSYKGLRNTPPDEYKFKKNEPSPNPHGRPKGSKNIKTIVAQIGKITTKTVKNGRRRTANAIQVAMEVQLGKALGGDTRAYLALIRTVAPFLTESPPEKQSELTPDERRILENIIELRRLLGEDS